jgi:methyl-accepting chemotaxis protein
MRWRGLTLRHTILLAIVAAVLVPTALLWSAEQVITRREFEPVIAQSRQATLAIVAAEAVSPVWSIDEREIAAVAERSLADPGLLAIRITERRPGAAPTLRSKTGADLDRAVRLAAPLSREGEPLGEVELWFDAGQVDRLLDERSRAISLLVAAQVGIAALVLWWILMRRLVQPLQVLKRQASDIAANVDAAPVGWQRADELGELGHHLNEMQGQIRTLVERLQLKTAELTRTALHDGLTGLPNRRLFRELAEATLAHCARHQTRAALLFIDLDRFKAINDSMGHSAGDAVLLAVAARLSANLRSADLVCRHSGDEFLVLLRDAESYEAIAGTADRLLKAL